jgi:hypothetical protein
VTIVSHSWSGPGRFEDRTGSFGPFVRALAVHVAEAAPAARVAAAGQGALDGMTWTVGLLGAGVAPPRFEHVPLTRPWGGLRATVFLPARADAPGGAAH